MSREKDNDVGRFALGMLVFIPVYVGVGVWAFGAELSVGNFVKAAAVYGFVFAVLESRWVKRRFGRREDTARPEPSQPHTD